MLQDRGEGGLYLADLGGPELQMGQEGGAGRRELGIGKEKTSLVPYFLLVYNMGLLGLSVNISVYKIPH